MNDAELLVAKVLLGPFDPLDQDIIMRSATRALFEQFRKVMRAHAGNRSKLRQAEILCQIITDIVEYALETISRQTSFVDNRCSPVHGITFQQIHGQRDGQ